jgi:cysteinyl-tRNA synthetase
MLKIYNTLSGQKEVFEPLEPKSVRMYACGVTVYDYSHLGHARSALVFDVIRKYLQHSGYAVKYVRNFTDVDDKIINRALKQGVHWEKIADEFLKAYRQDMGRLGVVKANKEPKATKHISDIKYLIKTLVKKGHAYQVDGDVYYEVSTFPQYGRLSKRKAEDLLAGARVEVDERKRNPMDFALWKSSKPGEPKWPSPWGLGRPGWHIECSAMSMKHLGKTFDIHGGGMDLIFPHHENEIAQSCAATGKEFARYWIHNGFVQVNQEKMSKSLGNFFTIREIFEKSEWPEHETCEMLRYFLLTTHYRSHLDFSDQSLKEAKSALNGFYDLFKRLKERAGKQKQGANDRLKKAIDRTRLAFQRAMDDDFNTPAALAELQKLRGDVNKLLDTGLTEKAQKEGREAFRSLGSVLGLFQLSKWQFNPTIRKTAVDQLSIGIVERKDLHPPTEWMNTITEMPHQPRKQHPAGGTHIFSVPTLSDKEIKEKIDERNEARRRKDFKRADEIRAELTSFGITIEDDPDGTSRWKR